MKRLVTLFVFSFVCFSSSFSQSIAPECIAVDAFCDLDDLNGLTFALPITNSIGEQPLPLCPDGGAAHNILWLSFIAHEGDYTIKIVPENCNGSTTGMEGLQYGIYEDCSFVNSIDCIPDCTLETFQVPSNLLTPGDTYYMFVDGCSGSLCDLTIEIDGTYEGDYCTTTSTQDISSGNDTRINIYPNPAQSSVTVSADFSFNEALIYSVNGELVKKKSFHTMQKQFEIELMGWRQGLHFVELRNGEKTAFSRFVVE